LKLYDENIGKFKLNDCVSFYGILELKDEAANPVADDDK